MARASSIGDDPRNFSGLVMFSELEQKRQKVVCINALDFYLEIWNFVFPPLMTFDLRGVDQMETRVL
jgi:hypothetical protein